jgi:predicted esterase
MRFSRVGLHFVAICFMLASLTASGQITGTFPSNHTQPPTTGDSARTRIADSQPLTGIYSTIFGGGSLTPKHRNQNISYALDPGKERFVVYVPDNYTGAIPFGLIVFTAPGDDIKGIPFGWESVLHARHLMFVAAQNSGNGRERSRRMGLAVLGALEMMKHYRIDPNRVYASGFSGGARVAGFLGFFQADLFRGTIQNSGADFYLPVARVYATSLTDAAGEPYGIFHATTTEVEAAKRVRFALITGSNDFRRGNILDVFNGGFAKSGIQSQLFDVPGLGHDICDGQTLSAVLDFIEGAERH